MIDSSYFVDVSDALGLGNPTIVEKDYYVVQLLKLLQPNQFLDDIRAMLVASYGEEIRQHHRSRLKLKENEEQKDE
ncbi:hypothetical protein C2869_05455 [Saccharobesus litoralis]|uniref:Uncharacterized protein n=1 Tax=Saccharobesus litoralis TaxID=2172099 RepID=A0A2S0VP07_9ALTE|nr:hypothetical protein [Saccharobesus litoralis]AWB65923.1 hypothetical protein C2869_05455 [Saccharobesus litoralis]